jgi:hypothetical protein
MGTETNDEIAEATKRGGYHFKTANGLDAVLFSLKNPRVSKVMIACEHTDELPYRILPRHRAINKYLTLKIAIDKSAVYLVFKYWVEPWRVISVYSRHFNNFVELDASTFEELLLVVVDGKAYSFRDSLAGRAVHQAIIKKINPKIATLIYANGGEENGPH